MTRRFLNPTFLLASLDFALAVASFRLASLVLYRMDLDAAIKYIGPLLPRSLSFAALLMIGLLAMGLYRSRQRPRIWETVARVILGVTVGTVCFIMLFYLVPYLNSGRGVLALSIVFSCVSISAGRIALLRFIDNSPAKTRVLVLGTGTSALKIARLRRASDRRGFEIIGYVASSPADRAAADHRPELRPLISMENMLDFPRVNEVVVALDERRGKLPIDTLLQLKGKGTLVTDAIDFLERETGKIDLDLLSPSWFVYTSASYTNSFYRGTKYFVDFVLAALVFLVTLPIFALVCLSIRIEDGRRAPLFYRQRRVGRRGHEFELLKFRSMTINAESGTGPQWAIKNDTRVTHVGRIIRRFRIDELPQLVNVMRGEMSVVGPRPERPKFVEQLAAEIPMYKVRHNMRPGLAGWAQLNFPYGASVTDAREKLSYDIFYIKNASVLLDLLIFLQTIEVVIWGKAISMAGPVRVEKDAPKAPTRRRDHDQVVPMSPPSPKNDTDYDDSIAGTERASNE